MASHEPLWRHLYEAIMLAGSFGVYEFEFCFADHLLLLQLRARDGLYF